MGENTWSFQFYVEFRVMTLFFQGRNIFGSFAKNKLFFKKETIGNFAKLNG